MKTDRLIGIITTLLQRGKVTAPYLAEKFEVSRRTINRDVEDICKAGIPLVTERGPSGGISIAAGFTLDKNAVTKEELQAVLTGLSSLDSVAQDSSYRRMIDKFCADGEGLCVERDILIDLSSHYKDSLAPKIKAIRQAIRDRREIDFTYYSKRGEAPVSLEPCLLVFQWASWYVLGYSAQKTDFRLHKLNRMYALTVSDRPFQPRELPPEKLAFGDYFPPRFQVTALFEPGEAYRLAEEYGRDSFTVQPDGRLLFSFPFTNKDYLLSWLLGFGDKAELLEPRDLRPALRDILERAVKKYDES